jgi:prophage regulatory protein
MDERILRLPTVRAITGLSRSSIYQMVSNGSFPRPIPLGTRAVGWLGSEVVDWVAQRTAMRKVVK